MDRLEAMRIFLSAVEAGSLSAAGRQLNLPLATVSRRVAELEHYLKAQLLIRSSRQLTLTEAGRDYVDACKRILAAVSEAELTASGEYRAPVGDLNIAAPIVFGRVHVLPIVTEYLERYPDVNIALLLGDRNANLVEEHIDLAVRIGVLPDSRLIARQVGSIRYVVCGSPGYFAAHGTPCVPEDLAKHQCISFQALTPSDHWSFMQEGQPQSILIRSRLSVNTAEAALDAAMADFGVTRLLSYQIAAAERVGSLRRILSAFEPAALPVNLVYGRQGRLPLKLRSFLDFAADRLRTRLEAA